MKITVDEVKCQNHGLCAISAPDHFELDADGKLTYQKTFDEENLDAIEDAIDSCPLQAIVMDRDAA
ncbi:ferredoxin [Streptomyces sp. NPDC001709]